jgi:diguanylate cyclase (GGDEF)-like protein/putative nucleotidyltransferase with HDIG domain
MKRSLSEYIKKGWKTLDRSIYVGDRLKSNLIALTFVSLATMVLGLILLVVNLSIHRPAMVIASIITLISGSCCAYCSYILKNRELAIKIPIVFCIFVFTIYALTGAADGTALFWSLLMPIGMSYFVSVKYGIILSTYYSILFVVIFYTPIKYHISDYYTNEFMQRFPLLYIFLSIFTCMAMVQYHRTALFEIEHANRLTEEVAKQTAVAEERSRKIEQMSYQTIQTLAYAIDAKDPYTKGHSTRVSQYSVLIAEELGWEKERINDLKYAALLHDIGKIGVPDSILNKPRHLTEVEYDIIKSHTTMGGDILKDRVMIKGAEDIARNHHERYDGKGYPKGLKGEEISKEARIVAVADAFDAMSSNRVYRKSCDNDYIRKELINGKGTQFDPELVDIFIGLWDRGLVDDILKNDPEINEQNVETSSALLQEVVDTFVAQNTMDDIDITTGIMSRSTGEAAIAQKMQEESGCLVFMDVDNLKRINDTYGHDDGDRLLRLVGETLTQNSSNSICCRLGGDEFLFFMVNVSEKEAENRVKKIISDFEEKKGDDEKIAIATLSAGLIMSCPEDDYTDTYNKADRALYDVKQSGKNGYGFYKEGSELMNPVKTDLTKIVDSIRNSGSYQGAMNVEYREFAKIYELIANLEERYSYTFRLIVINLDATGEDSPGAEELERSMYHMEQSIRQTIRDVDILTRYGSRQFLVILFGTEPSGVKTAVDRIFRGYYKMNGSSPFVPSYTVAEPEKKRE